MQPHAHCTQPPMSCPRCRANDLRCCQTSNGKVKEAVIRSRVCQVCGFRFNTLERIRGGLTRAELNAQPDWRKTGRPARKRRQTKLLG